LVSSKEATWKRTFTTEDAEEQIGKSHKKAQKAQKELAGNSSSLSLFCAFCAFSWPIVLALLCALYGEISFGTSLQNLQSIKPEKILITLHRAPTRIRMMIED
jgi:hypothetical protein